MIAFPPPPDDVTGPIPRLDTLWKVERIVRDASERGEDPLSLAEIKRRLDAKSVRHSTIRICVDELARQGLVTITGRGVLWTYLSPKAEAWIKRRKWVRL